MRGEDLETKGNKGLNAIHPMLLFLCFARCTHSLYLSSLSLSLSSFHPIPISLPFPFLINPFAADSDNTQELETVVLLKEEGTPLGISITAGKVKKGKEMGIG